MPLRPGTQVVLQDIAPPVGVPTDTGVWFVAGLAEKGSVSGVPQKIQNMSDYATYLGARVSYGMLYDALDTFFREGGKTAYVARIVGPAAVLATKILQDSGPVNAVRIDAKNPGPWGNSLKVQVVAGVGGGTVQIVILDASNVELERSPDCATKSDIVAWSTYSNLVNAVDLGTGTLPAVAAAAALISGVDDQASITDAHWATALARHTSDLGPGQVSYPGRTTTVAYNQLTLHAGTKNRIALLDGADTSSDTTLKTAGTTQRTDANARYTALFAPWIKVPGITPNTTRDVPPSAMVAGLMARNDSTGSPNRPAAGSNGISRYALDVKNTWDDTIRDAMNTAGVNVIRNQFGAVKLYGYRTTASPSTLPNWVQLNNVRLYMAIVAKALAIAEAHVFHEIDGRGLEFGSYGGDLKGMLIPYYDAGSLYGDTPQEAFAVDVSDAVNTPVTIADGQLRAIISLRMSPFAELVVLQVVKVPVTQSLT